MKTGKLFLLAKYTAFYTFLGGTLIFAAHCLGNDSAWFLIGYFYIIIAFIINLPVLFMLLWRAWKEKASRSFLIKHAAYLLVNVPVMVAYIWFVLVLLNTMRITFINETGENLERVHIAGCQDKYIDHLSKGESQSVWISIPGDCSIHIIYLLHGKEMDQSVYGYCTTLCGTKLIYRIGGDNAEL